VLAGCCELETRSFGIHLHELSGRIHDPAFVRSNPLGTTILLLFTNFGRDFGLAQLPFFRGAADLFPSLNEIYDDPLLQRAQRRAIFRRRLLVTFGILLCLLGASIALTMMAPPDSLADQTGIDLSPGEAQGAMAGGAVLFVIGVVWIITTRRTVLPLQKAVSARFALLWDSFQTTCIEARHFRPGPALPS
jgi:hypothetical protein